MSSFLCGWNYRPFKKEAGWYLHTQGTGWQCQEQRQHQVCSSLLLTINTMLKISKPPETVQFKLPKPYGLETGLKVLRYKKCWGRQCQLWSASACKAVGQKALLLLGSSSALIAPCHKQQCVSIFLDINIRHYLIYIKGAKWKNYDFF